MWYTKFGQSGDIVLSSRVRLARNFENIPFGSKMTEADRQKVIDNCKDVLPDLKYIDLSLMPETDKAALSECHIISREMASNPDKCGILTNSDCTTCIMLCEEDHIRIQSMSPGFSLSSCMEKANELDDRIEEKCDLAFDQKLGYLTCCPTNVGTALRASVMMHLPALTENKNMESIIRSLSKIGITVRGFYGEGSQALGNIYQISNQVTLGVSEEETLSKLEQITLDLIEKERTLGQKIYEQNKFAFEDKIQRSFGTLTNARLLSSDEAMNLVSNVKWGINLGIINNISHETLNSVWYETLPANITKAHNTSNAVERDLKRAELFKEALSK